MLMKIQKHVMQKRNNTRTKLYTPSDFQMLVDEILSPIPLPLLPADHTTATILIVLLNMNNIWPVLHPKSTLSTISWSNAELNSLK